MSHACDTCRVRFIRGIQKKENSIMQMKMLLHEGLSGVDIVFLTLGLSLLALLLIVFVISMIAAYKLDKENLRLQYLQGTNSQIEPAKESEKGSKSSTH